MAKLVYISDCVYKIVVAPRSKRKGKDIAWSVTEYKFLCPTCSEVKQTKHQSLEQKVAGPCKEMGDS